MLFYGTEICNKAHVFLNNFLKFVLLITEIAIIFFIVSINNSKSILVKFQLVDNSFDVHDVSQRNLLAIFYRFCSYIKLILLGMLWVNTAPSGSLKFLRRESIVVII